MYNKILLKTILQGALSALEELPDNSNELIIQSNLIQQIEEVLKNKKKIDTCEVTITNNCGIAEGIAHPICIYITYENNEFKTKFIRWRELLETPTIEVIKGTPLIFKDENFLGIAITISKSNNKQEYTDGSLFHMYKIIENCDINIYG